jgi:hypothetical protein
MTFSTYTPTSSRTKRSIRNAGLCQHVAEGRRGGRLVDGGRVHARVQPQARLHLVVGQDHLQVDEEQHHDQRRAECQVLRRQLEAPPLEQGEHQEQPERQRHVLLARERGDQEGVELPRAAALAGLVQQQDQQRGEGLGVDQVRVHVEQERAGPDGHRHAQGLDGPALPQPGQAEQAAGPDPDRVHAQHPVLRPGQVVERGDQDLEVVLVVGPGVHAPAAHEQLAQLRQQVGRLVDHPVVEVDQTERVVLVERGQQVQCKEVDPGQPERQPEAGPSVHPPNLEADEADT